MRHTHSKSLYSYWNRLRGHRAAPDRKEIEPSDIRELLGETFILEIDRDYGTISFRLAGTRLCNAYGKELKGQGFLSLWQEQDNFEVFNLITNTSQECQPSVISFVGVSQNDQLIECEMLLLPLLNGDDTAARVLGACFQLENPKWYGIEPIIENQLKHARPIEIDTTEVVIPLAPVLLDGRVRHKQAGRKVQHLTVIDGGAR